MRVWREDVKRWSRAELRDEIEATSHRLGENRGHKLDERLIARWETGAVLRPQGVYRRLLAHMGAPLPVSGESLGLPSSVDVVVEMWGLRDNLEMLRTEMGDEMERRLLIA